MPIDKLTPRQLNADADSKLLTKSGMLDALNLYSGDDGGNQGVLKNIKGNLILTGSGSLPTDARVIGKVEDTRTGLAYLFVYSATASEQGIWVYDPNEVLGANKIKPIYKSPVFDFPQDGFVKGDVVYTNAVRTFTDKGVDFEKDAIIYFTDGVNEPRKINAYRAFVAGGINIHGDPSDLGDSSNAINEADFITACPKVPLTPITFEFASSVNERRNNFIGTRGFQFAYQHIYIDGMESAISPYSDIAFPPSLINQGAASFVDHSEYNECRLTIPTPGPEIKFTRILCRQGNTGSFLVIEEIDNYSPYLFYNDKILSGVSTDEVNKQFDSVPRTAVSQTTSSNRLFYGNYLDGFDNVKVTADTDVIYHEKEEDFKTFDVKVIPSIAPSFLDEGGYEPEDFAGAKTAAFVIDCTELPDSLSKNTIINVAATVAPDKNWHLYRFDDSDSSYHQSTQLGPQKQESVNNSFDGANSQLSFNQTPENSGLDFLNYADFPLFGLNFGVGNTSAGNSSSSLMYWRDESGASLNPAAREALYGTSAGNPLILKGGAVTFSVKLKVTSNIPENARLKINAAIRKSLTLEDGDGEGQLLNTESGLPSDSVELISRSHEPSYSFDLGLKDGDLISQSYIGDDVPSSSLSKLIVAVKNTFDPTANSYIPMGAFIVDRATVNFKAFEADNYFINSNPEKSHIGITIPSLTGVNICTCLHDMPPSINNVTFNSYALSWVIIEEATMRDPNFTIENFLSANGLSNELNFTTPPSLEDLGNNSNLQRQVSYLYSLTGNSGTEDFDQNFFNIEPKNLCVLDGEGGPGGSFSRGGNSSTNDFDKKFLYQQGSLTVNPFAVEEPHSVDSTAFFGGRIKVGDSFSLESNFNGSADNKATCLPLLFRTNIQSFPSAIYPNPEQSEVNEGLITSDSVNLKRLHSYVEVLSGFASILPPGGEYQDRSFKTEASHDFGVVYYDQRGRHGFVNPIDSVYVDGYSATERGTDKGRVSVNIKITSAPPEWAHFYKFVYAKNTSVKDFIQYSAAGAFTSSNEDQEVSDSNTNIYVSLNHLQGHPISYVSSFGARTPEGGLNFYKFEPGDKLRVISYAEGTEREYPIDLEFEVLGSVNLGNTDNPLSNNPTERQKGEFVIIKDNTNAGSFSFADVISGTSSWGDNCIIELKTPLKELEDDQRFYYEISDTYNIVKSTDGQTLNHSPAEVELTKGDVWFRRVAVNVSDLEDGVYPSLILDDDGNADPSQSNFKNVYLEASTATDLYRADSIGIGRPNVVLDGAKETVREATLTYSDPSNPESTKVNYSSFNASLANFKDLPEKYNSLQYLGDHGDSIFALQKDKASRIPVGRSIITSASGNESIVASRDVLGDAIYYAGQSGCDNDPSSVADIEGTVFFANKSLGKIYKYSRNGGVEAVSDKGMANFFRSMFRDALDDVADGDHVKVVGGYDPVKEEYLITVLDLEDLDTSGVVSVGQEATTETPSDTNGDDSSGGSEDDLSEASIAKLIEEFLSREDADKFEDLAGALTAGEFNAIRGFVSAFVKADINSDGAIGVTDLLAFSAAFNNDYAFDAPATTAGPVVEDDVAVDGGEGDDTNDDSDGGTAVDAG